VNFDEQQFQQSFGTSKLLVSVVGTKCV